MDNSTCQITVPGKLMIAGEYAVLEPKQKSVVIAVNRYVKALIKPCSQNKLSLPQMELEDITWETSDNGVQFSLEDKRLSFIKNSINVVYQFLKEKSISLLPFHLQIKSELDDPLTGKKYGLGSSAAVVASVVAAILHLHKGNRDLDDLNEIFKLSAIAHLKTQGSGSGADIAAAVFGGWLEYSAFNTEWILNELNHRKKLADIVNKPWPNLLIKPITPPILLQLAVGWTQEAASTVPMIKMVQSYRESNFIEYNEFLKQSSNSVERLIEAFEMNDYAEAINALAQNRKALAKLGENVGITIETEKLKKLCSIAGDFGSGKSSGAGGGDCGIAFLKSGAEKEKLYKTWKEAGIIPLDLSVSSNGVMITELKCESQQER